MNTAAARKVLVAAAAVVLAGCGSGAGESAAAPSSPPPASSSSPHDAASTGTTTTVQGQSTGGAPQTPAPQPRNGSERPSAQPTDESAHEHQPERCHTSELRGRLGDENTASGTLTERIYLTNASDHTCTLYGYPGVAPAQQSGALIAYETVRSVNPAQQQNTERRPEVVELQPGRTAHAVLSYYYGWMTAQQKDDCVHWSAMAVTPPDEQDHLLIPNSGTACHVGPFAVGVMEPGSA